MFSVEWTSHIILLYFPFLYAHPFFTNQVAGSALNKFHAYSARMCAIVNAQQIHYLDTLQILNNSFMIYVTVFFVQEDSRR